MQSDFLFALTLTLSLCYLLFEMYHKSAEYKTDESPHGYFSWHSIWILLVHQDEVSKGEPLNRVELFTIRPDLINSFKVKQWFKLTIKWLECLKYFDSKTSIFTLHYDFWCLINNSQSFYYNICVLSAWLKVSDCLAADKVTYDHMNQFQLEPWPEIEDMKRSGVRAHVLLIIQCTIQISGLVWQIQNGCSSLLV
jgi:hypothetical protein